MKNPFVLSVTVSACLVSLIFMDAVQGASGPERLQLSVALRAEYTDNRDSVDDDDPDVSKESTWDYVVAPSIDLVHNIRLTFFRFRYDPTFRHRSNPREDQNDNTLHHNLLARIDHESGRRLSMRLENRFSYSDDPEVSVGEEILRTDRSFYYNRLTAGANYALTRRTGVDIEGGLDTKRYDEQEAADTSDEDRFRGQVRVQRQHTANFAYSALVRGYRIERVDALDLNRDLDVYFAGAGIRNVFAKRWVLDADAGYQWIEYDDPEINGESSPFLEGRLTYRASSLTQFYIGGSYTMTEAYNYPFVAQDKRSMYSGIVRDLPGGFRIGGEGEYRVETYEAQRDDPDTPEGAFIKDEREGDTIRVLLSGWLDYQLQDGVNLKVRHYHENVDSDVSTTFTRNLTRAELRFQF